MRILFWFGTLFLGTLSVITLQQQVRAESEYTSVIPYSSLNLELINQIGTAVNALAVQNEWVYAAVTNHLKVFDTSDPENITYVDQLELPITSAHAMTVYGDRLIIVGQNGLVSVDIGDPATPYLLATIYYNVSHGSQQFEKMIIDQERVYVLVLTWDDNYTTPSYSEILVFDVSDPAQVINLGAINGFYVEEAIFRSMDVKNDHLIYSLSSTLRIIDVADISMPVEVGSYTSQEHIGDILTVWDNYVVSLKNEQLHILDISNPSAIVKLGDANCCSIASFNKIKLVNGYIYILESGQLHIVDFLDPYHPGQSVSTTLLYGGRDLAVTQDNLYFFHASGFNKFQLDFPNIPIQTGSYHESVWGDIQIASVEDQIYFKNPAGHYRLTSRDWSHADPLSVDFFPDRIYDNEKDDISFDFQNGDLNIYNISNLNSPIHLGSMRLKDHFGSFESYSWGRTMVTEDQYGYIGATSSFVHVRDLRVYNFLYIVDISLPDTPVLISRVYLGGGSTYDDFEIEGYDYVNDIFIKNNYLYLLTNQLSIIDITNPHNPIIVNDSALNLRDGKAMALYGEYALIVNGGRLLVLDLSNPMTPQRVGSSYYIMGIGIDVAIHDGLAFVTVEGFGVNVWDISDITQLTLLGYYTGDMEDILVKEDEIYIEGANGLYHLRLLEDDVTKRVGLSHSMLESTDGQTTLLFNQNTFTDITVINYRELNRSNAQGELWGMNHFFDITAVDADTLRPIRTISNSYTISINYRDTGGIIEDSLALYYWDGIRWQIEETSSLDTSNNLITARPNQFGKFALLGDTNYFYLPFTAGNP